MAEQKACDITIYCKGNIGGTRMGDCPFSQKALLCASLHGLSVERKLIDLANKPQSFLDLNKVSDGSFKLIAGDSWKGSTPVMEDRTNKVRLFDSGEIVSYLESTYKPAVLSANNADLAQIAGANAVFGAFINLIKDVGSKNNGVFDEAQADEQKLSAFKTALHGVDEYLSKMGQASVYLNGTDKVCQADIELLPKLHLIAVHAAHALNVNVANMDKATEYPAVCRYVNLAYAQKWWQENTGADRDTFDFWRKKFGVNSHDGEYPAEEEAKQSEDDKAVNIGFYAVPDSKEKLYDYLCAAMSLELSTLPLYITALYSFKDDEKLSESAKAAKKLVLEVIMDEMLHMNLLNNIISSIYGVSKVTTKFNIPYGKDCKLPAQVRADVTNVSLKPFCKQSLYDAFIQIEAPTTLVDQHQPEKQEDGSLRYPFEPKKGEDSVTLTFQKRDHLNQIGEFYNAIEVALKRLSEQKLISFTADDKEHKQRQCKSRKKDTDDITELQDALEAIELICTQGEGYELKEGVFAGVQKSDGDDNPENDLQTSEKTHFIKFIECLVGRELVSLKCVKDTKETVTYTFTYDGKASAYKVDFENEVYSVQNFVKPAPAEMFNKYYKDMLEKLTEGLKVAEIGESVQAMRGLKARFKECMEKGVYPTFEVPEFPLPPSVGAEKK